MARPTFSVVIPTYNRWPVVAEAVQSVLDQSYRDVQPVVVDDESTDGTVDHLRACFPDLVVVRQPNSERGAARNRGVRESATTHVTFLDSDDRFAPEHLSGVAAALHATGSDAVATAASMWNPASGSTWVLATSTGTTPLGLDDALWGNPVPIICLTVSRPLFDATGGFPEDRALAGSEDWVFLLRVLARQPVPRTGVPSALIRTHPGRSMADPVGIVASRRAATALLEAEGIDHVDLDRSRRRLLRAGSAHFAAAHRFEAGDMRGAREALRSLRGECPGWEGLRLSWRLWVLSMLGRRGSNTLRSTRDALGGRT